MYEEFYQNPIIKKIAPVKAWTVSDNTKMPIDATDLFYRGILHGAVTKDPAHCPFVDLYTLSEMLPNATNNAFCLDAVRDGIIVLDIEPGCPDDIKHGLLRLPSLYAEYSMSGRGYHLIFPLPESFMDIAREKTAVKEEHKYYEFLCNHYVTFTRNVVKAEDYPGFGTSSYDAFLNLWESLASRAGLSKKVTCVDAFDAGEETEWSEEVRSDLMDDDYRKTPEDFFGDMSIYEFGFTAHIYHFFCGLINLPRRLPGRAAYAT